MGDLARHAWPASDVAECLEALARAAGLPVEAPREPGAALHGADGGHLPTLAAAHGLEAQPVEAPFREVARMVAGAGPALVRLPSADGPPGWLAVTRGGARWLEVLAPDGARVRIGTAEVADALGASLAAPLAQDADRLLELAGLAPRRRERARALLLEERLGPRRVGGVWLLRCPPGRGLVAEARRIGLLRLLLGLVGVHAVQQLLWVLSWWIVGWGALQGRLDAGWLAAWGLCLLTLVPLRALGTWLQGRLSLGAGQLLKQRLLGGALRMPADEVRRRGAGELLSQVLESDAVESLALSGGLLSLTACVELVIAAAVLGLGAVGTGHVGLLAAWVGLLASLGVRYLRRRRAWTDGRLAMTHELVERMVGHRTRLAQQPREAWHDGEDEPLERYLQLGAALDRSAARLLALGAHGWLVAGVLGLVPAFVVGSSPAALAVALGGVLLAASALGKLVPAGLTVCGAAVAWRAVAPLWGAAAARERLPVLVASPAGDHGPGALRREGSDGVGSPRDARAGVPPPADGGEGPRPVLEAREVVFRHRDRSEPTLRGASLALLAGDRVLLDGPSGGGKSTLAAVLSGLRAPDAGLILARGLDLGTLGADAWRRRVAQAPQFHENHVLTETFAFNLLMGHRWPPRPEDVEEAGRVCDELGLGGLLQRMPAGLFQMVGETGWQLSHGEKSRLYLARALLQGSDVIVLDESFAALDPESLTLCIGAAEKRAATLLVIAHQ